MKSLLIVDRIVSWSKGSGKEHINQAFVKAHVQNGYETYLIVLNDNANHHQIEKCCESLSVTYVRPSRFPTSWEINRLKLIFSSIKHFWDDIFILKFIYRNNNLYPSIIDLLNKKQISFVTVSAYQKDDIGILGYLINEEFKIPFNYWEHRSDFVNFSQNLFKNIRKKRLKKIFSRCTNVLSISGQLSREMCKITHLKSVKVISNPVHNDFFSLYTQHTESSSKRFVFAGWQNWKRSLKRIDLLLLAFKEINLKYPDTSLMIAGQTPNDIKHQIHDLKIQENVQVIGKVPHSQIYDLILTMDCCVVTSDYETFGNPSAEAIASGKPIVSTRCGWLAEFNEDKNFLGAISDVNDVNGIIEGMEYVYLNKDNFDFNKIRNYAYENFSIHSFNKKWSDIYKKQ